METTAQTWPKRQRRHAVGLSAEVTTSTGDVIKARLSNLSLHGCQIATPLRIGDQVQLRIETLGEFRAEVRWSFLDQSGVRFIDATAPEPAKAPHSDSR